MFLALRKTCIIQRRFRSYDNAGELKVSDRIAACLTVRDTAYKEHCIM